MDLNDILVFAAVVRAGSFTAAAKKLDMPKSTVSRRVSALEERLGARLLQRTTRTLSLTDLGRTYYQHATRVVSEVEEAELSITRMQEAPRGLLRVTLPLDFSFLGPAIASFAAQYPEVQLELVCTDRVVDLVDDGFDLGIRAGRLADSSLVARTLAEIEGYLVASEALLADVGTPKHPQELATLPCVAFGAGTGQGAWRLVRDGKTVTVALAPRLVVNDFDLLAEAALSGLGFALLPAFRCREALDDGRLRRVLADWCSPPTPVSVVYPSTRHLSPKVRAFVDHLRDAMSPPPWSRAPAKRPRAKARGEAPRRGRARA